MRRRGLFFFKLHVCYVFELSCFSRASSSFFFSERGLQAALPLHHFLFKVNNTLFLLFSSSFLKTKSVTRNTSICFSFFFFQFTVLYRVCVLFSSCVFLVSALVCTFFFFSAFKKKKPFFFNAKRKQGEKALQLKWHNALRLFFFLIMVSE